MAVIARYFDKEKCLYLAKGTIENSVSSPCNTVHCYLLKYLLLNKAVPLIYWFIIETSSTFLRNNILKQCKFFNMNGSEKLSSKHLGLTSVVITPIYVSAQLTAKASRLYFLGRCRDVVRSTSYEQCGSSYGKIFFMKDSQKILLHSEAQIQQLLKYDVTMSKFIFVFDVL